MSSLLGLPYIIRRMLGRFRHYTVRQVAAVLLGVTLGFGCALTPDRLPELERRFYDNLPSAAEQKTYLHTKEAEQRKAILERNGMWARWNALPESERQAALEGRVELGFHEFAVHMAWGPPADTQTRDRAGRPATIHTYIRCTSGPHVGQYVRSNLDCNGTSSETQVAIAEDIVVELNYPD